MLPYCDGEMKLYYMINDTSQSHSTTLSDC